MVKIFERDILPEVILFRFFHLRLDFQPSGDHRQGSVEAGKQVKDSDGLEDDAGRCHRISR